MPHHQLHLARPGRDVRLWNPKLVCQFQSVEKSSQIVNSKVLPWPPCRFTKNFGKKYYVCPSWKGDCRDNASTSSMRVVEDHGTVTNYSLQRPHSSSDMKLDRENLFMKTIIVS
ncbi:hypothetical protein OROMI_014191 [Orobanche minor]